MASNLLLMHVYNSRKCCIYGRCWTVIQLNVQLSDLKNRVPRFWVDVGFVVLCKMCKHVATGNSLRYTPWSRMHGIRWFGGWDQWIICDFKEHSTVLKHIVFCAVHETVFSPSWKLWSCGAWFLHTLTYFAIVQFLCWSAIFAHTWLLLSSHMGFGTGRSKNTVHIAIFYTGYTEDPLVHRPTDVY